MDDGQSFSSVPSGQSLVPSQRRLPAMQKALELLNAGHLNWDNTQEYWKENGIWLKLNSLCIIFVDYLVYPGPSDLGNPPEKGETTMVYR